MSLENKWTADEQYIYEEAGCIAKDNSEGRTYNKTNPGKAIAIIVRDTNGTWPILISTNYDAVQSWCSYKPSYKNETIEFEYMGLIWYAQRIPYGFYGAHSYSGFAKTLSISMDIVKNTKEVSIQILDKINVQVRLYSEKIKNSVKDTILSHKLIKEHVVIQDKEE